MAGYLAEYLRIRIHTNESYVISFAKKKIVCYEPGRTDCCSKIPLSRSSVSYFPFLLLCVLCFLYPVGVNFLCLREMVCPSSIDNLCSNRFICK